MRADTLEQTAVLIPALNEEDALPVLLEALPLTQLHSVVVVDNGSTDDTAAVAVQGGSHVVEEGERGYGAACLAGLDWLASSPRPPAIVVFMDADHPEDATHIEDLIAAISDGADLAMGVRIDASGGEGNSHVHARLGNRLVLGLVRALFGHGFRDLGPFRAMRFSALQELTMDDRNWGWTLQMQLRALRLGMSIVELPFPHRMRNLGQSKISGSLAMSIRVGSKMFLTLFRERVRRIG